MEAQESGECPGIAAGFVGDKDSAGALQQRTPDFPDREVEGGGVKDAPDIGRAECEAGRGDVE